MGLDPAIIEPEELTEEEKEAGRKAAASRFEAFKVGAAKFGATFKEGTAKAAAATSGAMQTATKAVREKDWTREQQALKNVKQSAIGAAQNVARGGAAVLARTSDGVRKVFGGPVLGIAKQEHTARPCPRIVLVCCTSIVSGGLAEPGVFKEHANEDDLYCLFGAFEQAHGLVMPPTGTSPHVLGAVLKKFLITLPEPLLTFKALPDFIAAAGDPHSALELLPKLPPVNFNALLMLLETLYRVSEFAEHNGMTPAALAEQIAPCIAWHPIQKQRAGGWLGGIASGLAPGDNDDGLVEHDGYLISPRADLSAEEMLAVVAVLEYLIKDFKTWHEGIVFT